MFEQSGQMLRDVAGQKFTVGATSVGGVAARGPDGQLINFNSGK